MVRVVHIALKHRALDTRIFLKECRTLAATGYEVHLLVPDPPAPELDGVRLHPVPPYRPISQDPRGVLSEFGSVLRTARSLEARLYHIHEPELIPLAVALRRPGIRLVYDVHEVWPEDARSMHLDRPLKGWAKAAVWELLERGPARSFDAFVAATPTIASRFPPRRTIVVRNYPISDELWDPEAPPPARRPARAVYVGGLHKIRGLEIVSEALDTLPEDHPGELWIAGAPMTGWTLPSSWERHPRIHYLGPLDRPGVRRLFAAARVGILLFQPTPNHARALPNKLFEYMSAGLPVLASDFPLWRELLAETGAGWTVDPTDPSAIGARLAELLLAPERTEAAGAAGRRAVLERFSWEREAPKLLELYRELVGPSS